MNESSLDLFWVRNSLFNLLNHLNIAIQQNDRRSIIYFLGLITRYQYHPTFNRFTIVPIDMLLLQKTPKCFRKGCCQFHSKSQSGRKSFSESTSTNLSGKSTSSTKSSKPTKPRSSTKGSRIQGKSKFSRSSSKSTRNKKTCTSSN